LLLDLLYASKPSRGGALGSGDALSRSPRKRASHPCFHSTSPTGATLRPSVLLDSTAAEATTMLRIDQDSFDRLIEQNPSVARGIYRVLNQRLRNTLAQVAAG